MEKRNDRETALEMITASGENFAEGLSAKEVIKRRNAFGVQEYFLA